ncbi:Peroxidase 73 [Bienertia sinuspersici]
MSYLSSFFFFGYSCSHSGILTLRQVFKSTVQFLGEKSDGHKAISTICGPIKGHESRQRKGLFTSDQILYEDPRSKPTVSDWAQNPSGFNQGFIRAMTRLGRVGVKTGTEGNIRIRCDVFN